MEWVEVRGSTVEVAVEAALGELGLSSREQAEIEVVEEPTKGFLGMGSRDALVRVSRKPPPQEKRQRRRKGGRDRKKQPQGRSDRGENNRTRESGKADRERTQRKPARSKAGGGSNGRPRPEQQGAPAMDDATTPEVQIDTEGQAGVVTEFLNGLLESFGLEGEVTTRVEDDLIVADVRGEQTEALIGPKGSIMQSVGELTRTVVQRKTHRRARLRLDVGGYLERRREALRIYAGRLAEQVLDDGGEIMLEPMNPADRKTVHDAIVEIEGVRSFSEGEEPNRSVVIALAPGVEPRSSGSDDEATESGDAGNEDGETDAAGLGDSDDE
jgi:spoIIIJ-associated protein